MPSRDKFQHLPLFLSYQGKARLSGGEQPSPQTIANRNSRKAHSEYLRSKAESLLESWQQRSRDRNDENRPLVSDGLPILLQVDPNLDLDELREMFSFEIVAEQEDGYVIVAAEDIDLNSFLATVDAFSVQVHGSARIAQVHRLFDDPSQSDRLSRIMSEYLLNLWPQITDQEVYVVDIGIACVGTREIPSYPTRGKRDDDIHWARKVAEWTRARIDAYEAWDEIKRVRETEIEQFTRFYGAEILHIIDRGPFDAALPDSFTIRLKIVGEGLRDFVLTYAYIFEVVEPDDIALPQFIRESGERGGEADPIAPDEAAPTVCVIDSGIQENHLMLEPAIDHATSHCFLPGRSTDDVGDFVRPGGHGTRIAGAVLYGESIVRSGSSQLPFWIQNARVLDENNRMPEDLFPPAMARAAVEQFYREPRYTRIFNHSINASAPCRTRYMSAWAAEIDLLCAANDILFVQSVGNVLISGSTTNPGVKEHLSAGRDYPAYLYESSARVANPGQSLQALTVGSVSYGAFEDGDWKTFASDRNHPSAFSRSGLGIWNTIKPELVEYGGDDVRTSNVPPDIQSGGRIAAACPELIRSTVFPPGPLFDRDETGTSFAAPKVTRIAAQLQQLMPEEPAILLRALIIQSARWPTWAENLLTELRQTVLAQDRERRLKLIGEVSGIIRLIGYGLPDEERASVNTDYRTTLITNGETIIRQRECHVYQVPIPAILRGQADEYDIRVDVTLSYVAQPRRTRRNVRRYLSTWVDWKSSKLGEGLNNFRIRAMKGEESDDEGLSGTTLPWTLQEKSDAGLIRGIRRNSGTVQKDWAVVKSNALPDQFCIAVVGHQGWSRDPDSTARYALCVTFEILSREIAIYEPLRIAVDELQAEVEVDIEPEIEVVFETDE